MMDVCFLFVDILLRELLQVHLIVVVLECLAASGFLTCSANVAIPFEAFSSCDLMCGSQSKCQRSALPDHQGHLCKSI